jgi:hypothetical protein
MNDSEKLMSITYPEDRHVGCFNEFVSADMRLYIGVADKQG